MNSRSMLVMAALATVMAVGTAGCSAPSDGSNTDGEATGSSTDDLASGSCTPSEATGAVPEKQRALLDTVATTEGTRGRGQDGYNVTFAYQYFSSCTRHPDLRICAGKYCSTAAGRYQFLTTTWNGLGYDNFGPANQDRGAMKRMAQRGAIVPTGRALNATEFVNTMNRISWEWASLPPGRYPQPSYSLSAVRALYCGFAGC